MTKFLKKYGSLAYLFAMNALVFLSYVFSYNQIEYLSIWLVLISLVSLVASFMICMKGMKRNPIAIIFLFLNLGLFAFLALVYVVNIYVIYYYEH